jgi:hypothetical protein
MPQAKIVVPIETFLKDGHHLPLTVLFSRVAFCAAIVMMIVEVARVPDVWVGIQILIAFNLTLRCIAMLRAAGMCNVCQLLLRSNHDMRMLQLPCLARAVPLHDVGWCFRQRLRQWKFLETAIL